jgi:hypothetical protein
VHIRTFFDVYANDSLLELGSFSLFILKMFKLKEKMSMKNLSPYLSVIGFVLFGSAHLGREGANRSE